MATNTFVGVPQPDSARKPLLNLVDSARLDACASLGAAFFVSAARTLTNAGGRNAVGDLADDPEPKPCTDRAREHGTLIGRKHSDHADDQAHEDEKSHDDASLS
jgi:hypothetical protein